MTAQEELTKLETAYGAWVDAGCPSSYTQNGQSVTRSDMEWIAKRIDALRTTVARQTTGGFYVANFRADT